MNISLPESMKAWVDEQVAAGGYGTTSEFFRHLIREAQQRRLQEQIDAKLLQALESGKPIPVDAEYWEKKQQQLAKRVQRNRGRS
jgi:antitoxin ParD1/3/4